MANWRRTIQFKGIINNDDYDPENELEEIPKVAAKVIEVLKNERVPVEIIERFKKVKTEAAFNRAMGHFYDWADIERIWIQSR